MYTNTNNKKLKVNLVSETVFTVKGHGVHTAFLETKESLLKAGVDVKTNSSEKCDVVHIHTIGPYSLIKLLKNKKRSVVTAHVVPDSFVGSLVLAKLWLPLATMYLKFFYNQATAVIAVSPEVKRQLEGMGVKKKIYFIPNGVSLATFKKDSVARSYLRRKLKIKNEDFVVINVGQIQPRKGVETFINTAKSLPGIKFIWIGGMPFKIFSSGYNKMKKIQQDTPSNVFFLGEISFEKMPPYYNLADALFFPSLQENFPFTIIEAAASKLPLILRDLPIYKPVFNENFISGNEGSFRDIILKLKKDKEHYEEYSKKAYDVAKKYEDMKLIKEVLKIYQDIINKNDQYKK